MSETLIEEAVPGVLAVVHAEGESGMAAAEAVDDGAAAGTESVDDNAGGAGSDAGEDEAGGGESTDLGEAGEGGQGEGDTGGELSGAKLWNAAKEGLAALDPKLRSAINKEIHKADRIAKAFPEGVEKATATLKAYEQLAETPGMPSEKVIADTLAERNYFRELDAAYTNGSKEFVTKLMEAKPDSFDKLAPEIFSQYSQTNPDGFAGFVSRTVLQHMDAAEVPLHFKVLQTFLPQLEDGPAKDRVIEAIQAIYGWQNTLRDMAAKKPTVKEAAPKPGEDQATREQQLDERETQVTVKTWNAESLDTAIRTVYSEADKYAGSKKWKLTPEEKQKVLNKVGEELDIRLAQNKGYGDAMRGYVKAGNKTAFQQRLDAERKKLVPGAARRAVDDVVADRPKAQPVKKEVPGQKPAAGSSAAAADTTEKVEWISGHPSTLGLVIDLNRTSHAMLLKKRGFIKGQTTNTPKAWK